MERRVNRHGTEEPFEERKVYASVYHAARESGYREQEAEDLAADIVDAVQDWLQRGDDLISVRQLRAKIIQLLKDEDEITATTYQNEVELR